VQPLYPITSPCSTCCPAFTARLSPPPDRQRHPVAQAPHPLGVGLIGFMDAIQEFGPRFDVFQVAFVAQHVEQFRAALLVDATRRSRSDPRATRRWERRRARWSWATSSSSLALARRRSVTAGRARPAVSCSRIHTTSPLSRSIWRA
jgi:hypothetical protein